MSFLVAGIASASLSLIGGGIAAGRAAKAQRLAEAKERENRDEMDRLKGVYANLDTSNPFLGMENTMEDLTVNQQQAQFQSQQFQQSQANILGGLRNVAGGSGIASLAQSLAQQGQLAAQQSSASIGRQESANQRAAAQQAGMIQMQERRGEIMSRNMKRDQTGTLLGMSQQETAAARQQAQMAEQAKFSAISSGIQGAVGAVSGMASAGAFDSSGVTDSINSSQFTPEQLAKLMAEANLYRD